MMGKETVEKITLLTNHFGFESRRLKSSENNTDIN